MKIARLFHLNCAEAERFCDKAQYHEASGLEKLKLRLHFALCKTCRKYHENNGKLSVLIKKAGIQTCTPEEKEAFRRKMQAEASNIGRDQQT